MWEIIHYRRSKVISYHPTWNKEPYRRLLREFQIKTREGIVTFSWSIWQRSLISRNVRFASILLSKAFPIFLMATASPVSESYSELHQKQYSLFVNTFSSDIWDLNGGHYRLYNIHTKLDWITLPCQLKKTLSTWSHFIADIFFQILPISRKCRHKRLNKTPIVAIQSGRQGFTSEVCKAI